MTFGNFYVTLLSKDELKNDHSRTIPFITTHPNVSISLFKDGTKRDTYLEVFRNHYIKEKTNKLVKILSLLQGLEILNKKFEMVVRS
jgi:hypothetical protein